jgi:hypothetical protein
MKYLLVFTLLTSCAPKPKTYTEVGIGMSDLDFYRICGAVPDESKTTQTANELTKVVTNRTTEYNGNARPFQCVGKFVFINGELNTISR